MAEQAVDVWGQEHRRLGRPGRRRASRRCLAAAIVVLLVVTATSCGWLSYGFDLANSRTNTSETKIGAANVATLQEKWRVDGLQGVTSTPATDGASVFFGSWDGKVRSVDAVTGASKWATQMTSGGGFGPMVDDSPALANGLVYIGDGEGRLHALNAATGAIVWTVVLDAHPNARIFSSPIVDRGKIYVGVGSYELAFEQPAYTFKGSIVALDEATGGELWRFSTTNDDAFGGAGASVWSSPAIDKGRKLLYVGVGQSYEEPASQYTDSLLAINTDTGTLAWHRQFTAGDVYRIFKTPINGPDADLGASPNLFTIGGQDVVGIGDKAGVYAVLDRVTGATVWAKQLTSGSHLGGVMLTAAVHDGVIYVSSNNMVGDVTDFANPANTSTTFALNAADGATVWQTPVPAASFGALTLANGLVYQPTITGSYYVINAATGAIVTTLTPKPGAQIGGGITVWDGVVYAPYGFWFFLADPNQQGGLVAFTLPPA